MPSGVGGTTLPLAIRIIQVARVATFQRLIWDDAKAAEIIRGRGGGAFEPEIATCVADDFERLVGPPPVSAWGDVQDREPVPHLVLTGDAIDQALAAVAEFTDLVSPYLAGHSCGVAELAASAAQVLGLGPGEVTLVRRAGLVHDIGRVGVASRIWVQPGPLASTDGSRSGFIRTTPSACCPIHRSLRRSLGLPVRPSQRSLTGHSG